MNAGYWTLRAGADFTVKEYDPAKNTYLLFDTTAGPYYLIDRRAMELLRELQQPQTTPHVHDKLAQAGIAANEGGAMLSALERAGVLVHSEGRPAAAGRLHSLAAMAGPVSELRFRLLVMAALGLLSLVLFHYAFLLATRFSLLTAVRRAPMIEDYLLGCALVVVFAILHEAAHCGVHYLACGRFPWPVSLKPMGAIFQLPVPKVNLNLTYLLDSRTRRIAVLSAGLGMDILLIWFSLLMVIVTRQAPLWVYLSWFCMLGFIFNLLPLWKSDGYYILSEAARLPDLSRGALDALKRMKTGKDNYSAGLALYGASKILFETAILVALLVVWYRLASLLGNIGRILFWSVFAGIFVFKFIQGYRAHNRR